MSLVLWSGGCDSTLLLHNLLAQRRACLSNDEVRAISITHPQLPANEENKRARTQASKVLEKLHGKFEHLEITITHNDGAVRAIESGGGLTQPMIWVLYASLHLLPAEDLYIGYVKGDCIWNYRHELYAAFNSIQWINHRTGVLKLPLENTGKTDIIKSLKNVGLYRHTWYCEDPVKGKKCSKCTPCKTHRTAVWQLKEFGI